MTEELYLEDGRDLPIFIHSELDDLDLTLEEFRVYAHLARRAGKNNKAWPSYNSIGEACFRASYPKANQETLRRKAIAAVKGLVDRGLVEKITNRDEVGNHANNGYRLTPRSKWGGSVNTLPSVNAPGGSVLTLGSGTAPKGTPIEGTTKDQEGERANARAAAAPAPPVDPPVAVAVDPPQPKPKKEPKPIKEAHPAVTAYRELHERFPSKAQMKLIEEANPPLEEWIRAIRKWASLGYSPANIEGMLEWARNPSLMDRKRSSQQKSIYAEGEASYNPGSDAEIEAARTWYREAYPENVADQ